MDSRPSTWRFVGLRYGMMRMDAQAARSERAQQGADDEGSGPTHCTPSALPAPFRELRGT